MKVNFCAWITIDRLQGAIKSSDRAFFLFVNSREVNDFCPTHDDTGLLIFPGRPSQTSAPFNRKPFSRGEGKNVGSW